MRTPETGCSSGKAVGWQEDPPHRALCRGEGEVVSVGLLPHIQEPAEGQQAGSSVLLRLALAGGFHH